MMLMSKTLHKSYIKFCKNIDWFVVSLLAHKLKANKSLIITFKHIQTIKPFFGSSWSGYCLSIE